MTDTSEPVIEPNTLTVCTDYYLRRANCDEMDWTTTVTVTDGGGIGESQLG